MKKRVFSRARPDPEWLDALLCSRLSLSLAEAKALIERGAVHVDGRRTTERDRVAVGARLIVFCAEDVAEPEAPLVIVMQDHSVAVIDKAAGIPTQAERSDSDRALDAQVQRQLGHDARMMHRLDKDASGLVLFALDRDARAPLQHALDNGEIERRYVAIVVGRLEGESTIKLRIGRHASDTRLRAAFPESALEGQVARSRYRALAHHANFTAVELTLDTGRTHQLRVHLSAIGHPIVGDVAYGGSSHARLCLHAHALAFPHPRRHERIETHSRLPPSFGELVPGLTSPFA